MVVPLNTYQTLVLGDCGPMHGVLSRQSMRKRTTLQGEQNPPQASSLQSQLPEHQGQPMKKTQKLTKDENCQGRPGSAMLQHLKTLENFVPSTYADFVMESPWHQGCQAYVLGDSSS